MSYRSLLQEGGKTRVILILVVLVIMVNSTGLASGQLGIIAEPIDDTIYSLLYGETEIIRGRAADRLFTIYKGDGRAVDPLFIALTDESPRVRGKAARALGNFNDERIIDTLVGILESNEYDSVRYYAALGLGDSRDTRVVNPLCTALKDNSPLTRRGAAIALGHINDSGVIDPLIEALQNDECSDVRGDAAYSLGSLALRGLRDERVIGPVANALNDEDAYVRQRAVSAHARVMGDEAVDEIIKALEDEDKDVRREAVVALRELGIRDDKVIKALTYVAENDIENLNRGTAQRVLDSLG